jgi:uncharacterized SAM-binding protein YcdF (DUF218 family)
VFFFFAKVFWTIAQPLNLATLLVLACLVASLLRWPKVSIVLALGAFLILGVSTWTTLGALMLHPLEDRFARPDATPERVDGIVVLGGGLEGGINLVRGGYELNDSGDRFVEAAALARRYPEARILVSGGTGTLILDGEGDAHSAPRLLTALGVAPQRLILEDRARDTYENALLSKQLAQPQPGEIWLLVTSAFHMPRSVALFRKMGFPVVPWPTDYRTAGNEPFGPARDNAADSLQNVATALREWIGLVGYRLSGRIDELLPEPDGKKGGEAGLP